ncbi:MAG: hypothetical protein GX230_09585 [Lentisphaerae bacterium]|jgi:hypothetical protein|nr:hypothetical protein [Lentisphaerota bacterium]
MASMKNVAIIATVAAMAAVATILKQSKQDAFETAKEPMACSNSKN